MGPEWDLPTRMVSPHLLWLPAGAGAGAGVGSPSGVVVPVLASGFHEEQVMILPAGVLGAVSPRLPAGALGAVSPGLPAGAASDAGPHSRAAGATDVGVGYSSGAAGGGDTSAAGGHSSGSGAAFTSALILHLHLSPVNGQELELEPPLIRVLMLALWEEQRAPTCLPFHGLFTYSTCKNVFFVFYLHNLHFYLLQSNQ